MSTLWRLLECINPMVTWSKFMGAKRKAIEHKDMISSQDHLRHAQQMLETRMAINDKTIAAINASIPDLLKQKQKSRAVNEYKRMLRLKRDNVVYESRRANLQIQEEQLDKLWTDKNVFRSTKDAMQTHGAFSEKDLKEADDMMEKMEEANEGAQKLNINLNMLYDTGGSAIEEADEAALMSAFAREYLADDNSIHEPAIFPEAPKSKIETAPVTRQAIDTNGELSELVV